MREQQAHRLSAAEIHLLGVIGHVFVAAAIQRQRGHPIAANLHNRPGAEASCNRSPIHRNFSQRLAGKLIDDATPIAKPTKGFNRT
jgi:hypothetical protein